jgi:hypothetical protein
MATLFIWEFSKVYQEQPAISMAKAPGTAQQTVALSGSAAYSTAFNAATGFIRVTTDTTCSIDIGPEAKATTSSPRLAAGAVEYFEVNPGDILSAIENS